MAILDSDGNRILAKYYDQAIFPSVKVFIYWFIYLFDPFLPTVPTFAVVVVV